VAKLLLILLVGGALANSLAQPSQPPLLIDNGSRPAALDAAD
jgi:hypothetical protein